MARERQTKSKVPARRLKGFQDQMPAAMMQRQRIIAAVQEFAGRAGFLPIETPALEYAETLLGVGGETDKQVYRFRDNGDRDVMLRFDLTVPFARYVAEHQGTLPFPFKRQQIGSVWRAEKPQRGRYREFTQCDLDVIGVDSALADSEIILAFDAILNAVLAEPYTIAVGQRALLERLVRTLLPKPDLALAPVLIALDKLAKIGPDGVEKEIVAGADVAAAEAQKLIAAVLRLGEAPTPWEDLKALLPADDEEVQGMITRWATTTRDLQAVGAKVRPDLSITRGLAYYTGIVFETTLDNAPELGSICSGGRYDRLADRFGGRALPGIGGSLGLDRLVAHLMTDTAPPPGAGMACVVTGSAAWQRRALECAQALRRAGIPCDLVLHSFKFGNQFKWVDRQGFAHAIVIGEDEHERGVFTLKTMASGEQRTGLTMDALIAALSEE